MEEIPEFIPGKKEGKGMNATWYEGPKKAMVFKTGSKGLGYYLEHEAKEIRLSDELRPNGWLRAQ